MCKMSWSALWVSVVLFHGAASAQWGKSASLFSEDGVEVSLDVRVFGVFALLNAIGYDAEQELGPPPLRRPQFSAVRDEMRSRMGRPGPATQMMKQVVKDFAVSASSYTEAALELGAAPKFEAPADASALAKALVEPLRNWHNEEGGAANFGAVAPMSGAAQKGILTQVDTMCSTLAQNVNLGSDEEQLLDDTGTEGRVVVILNELDAHQTLLRTQREDATYLVTGPLRDDADTRVVAHAAALSFARTLFAGEAKSHAAKAGLWTSRALLQKASQDVLSSPESFVTEVLACSLLRKVFADARCEGSVLATDPGAAEVVEAVVKRLQTGGSDARLADLMPALVTEISAPPTKPRK